MVVVEGVELVPNVAARKQNSVSKLSTESVEDFYGIRKTSIAIDSDRSSVHCAKLYSI